MASALWLRKFMRGEISKKDMGIYLGGGIILVLLGWVLAALRFPTPYSIRFNQISQLGSYILNPEGAWFFNFSMVFLGFLLIPFILYLHRIFGQDQEFFAQLALGWSVLACLGTIGVGIFPGNLHWPHVISAGMAFTGFYLAALCYFIVVLLILIIFIDVESALYEWMVFLTLDISMDKLGHTIQTVRSPGRQRRGSISSADRARIAIFTAAFACRLRV